jgi:hypothetical protein
MENEPENVVMTMRVGSAAKVVNGSRTGKCYQCQHDVWISPSSEEKLNAGYSLICHECGINQLQQHAAASEEITIENLSPNNVQLKEIIEALRGPGSSLCRG